MAAAHSVLAAHRYTGLSIRETPTTRAARTVRGAQARGNVVRTAYLRAGPSSPEPSYEDVDNLPHNALIMGLFRRKMVEALDGEDVPSTGYTAIIDLTRKLNSRFKSTRETQLRTVAILASLMPSWLPGLFKIMFSQPFPALACKLNAWATALTCQWLMGKCDVNDVEVDGGQVARWQGVKVERCRYLEQTGCASVCINSCKVPTQEFFATHMGLPLTLTPNYETYECQFAFGKTPLPQSQDAAFASPCFVQCPSKRPLLAMAYSGQGGVSSPALDRTATQPGPKRQTAATSPQCHKVSPQAGH
ncbi:hypothetical protein V8C86DRAFT_2555231 [Haematococcus lacustris]